MPASTTQLRRTICPGDARAGICLVILSLCFIGCAPSPSVTNEDVTVFKEKMQTQAAFAQAALVQQSAVQLIAPDVHRQLQQLAAEIAVSAGSEMSFRVHITNENYPGTYSMASGDIFIPVGYLNMVESRDEIAFGLAREIAIQHRQLPLRDLEAQYLEQQRHELIATVAGIVTSSVIQGVYYHYVTGPIHRSIMKEINIPVQTLLVEDSSGNPQIVKRVPTGPGSTYANASGAVSSLLSPTVGWLPSIATRTSLKMISQLLTLASEEADADRRKLKNELGLTYMQLAGYAPAGGQRVIDKLDQFWKDHESDG